MEDCGECVSLCSGCGECGSCECGSCECGSCECGSGECGGCGSGECGECDCCACCCSQERGRFNTVNLVGDVCTACCRAFGECFRCDPLGAGPVFDPERRRAAHDAAAPAADALTVFEPLVMGARVVVGTKSAPRSASADRRPRL